MKRKTSEPQYERPRLTLESVTLQYLADLRDTITRLRSEVDLYRGKCQRLELSIMNSETKGEARIEYVERTDPGIPSIRSAQVPTTPVGYKPRFRKLEDDWNRKTPAEQAEALGIKPAEPVAT